MGIFTDRKLRRESEDIKAVNRFLLKAAALDMPITDWLKAARSGDSSLGYSSTQSQIDQSFKSIVWYFAAVRLIAQSAGAIPLKLFRVGKDDTEIFQNPVLDLITKKPNQLKSATTFREALYYFRNITGNAYVEIDWATVSGSGNPLMLTNLLTQNVTPKETPGAAFPLQYIYQDSKNVQRTIEMSNMMHWMTFNPDCDYEGLSPITVARRTIDAYNYGKTHNNSLMKNMGRTVGLLSTTGSLTSEQRIFLRQDLENIYNGPLNAGKIAIGESGLQFSSMGFSPVDMDWLQSQKLSMREVCAIVGVPSELLGDSDNKTYSNAKEARAAVYDLTIMPQVNGECDLYNHKFFPKGDFYFKPDTAQVDALKRDDSLIAAAMAQSWWLTGNERRLRMGMDERKDPALDQILIPTTLMPGGAMTGDDREL